MKCPRCQRSHSGVCGITPRVSIGGPMPVRQRTTDIPHATGKGTGLLENLLTEAQTNKVKVMEMLKLLPPSVAAYAELLDREGKLDSLIKTLAGQIASRNGVK